MPHLCVYPLSFMDMESFKNLFTLQSILQLKKAPLVSSYSLQNEFKAQTTWLQNIYKAQRPKNTTKMYEPKQKEWKDQYAKLEGSIDGTWVTEDKLCLFLKQQVIN